jgi:hypothetical protein
MAPLRGVIVRTQSMPRSEAGAAPRATPYSALQASTIRSKGIRNIGAIGGVAYDAGVKRPQPRSELPQQSVFEAGEFVLHN